MTGRCLAGKNGTVTLYNIDTGNVLVFIGIIEPSGLRVPCHEAVGYSTNGSQISVTQFITYDGQQIPNKIPGLQAGVLAVDWVYNGVAHHLVDMVEVYCDANYNFTDSVGGGDC
jgi:hypothetical protein